MRNPPAAVIAVLSPKGGVGKTTVAANLAASLAARGRPVLLIDLDPQNALRLHHREPLESTDGIAPNVTAEIPRAATECVRRGPFGADLLAYGTTSEEQRAAFEGLLLRDPHWLGAQIGALSLPQHSVVLVDTPPGPSIYQRQVLAVADLALVVMLPDAASFVTIPTMETTLRDSVDPQGNPLSAYVVNRMNPSRPLCREVVSAMESRLGGRLAPVRIRFDAAVEESLAYQSPVIHHAPAAAATQDFGNLADWVGSWL